jgi:hypothetical protein
MLVGFLLNLSVRALCAAALPSKDDKKGKNSGSVEGGGGKKKTRVYEFEAESSTIKVILNVRSY